MRFPQSVIAKLLGFAVFTVTHQALAEQVPYEKIEAIRQVAIDAGQTSSSTVKKPAKSEEEKAAERAAIEGHRKAFFERTYGRSN